MLKTKFPSNNNLFRLCLSRCCMLLLRDRLPITSKMSSLSHWLWYHLLLWLDIVCMHACMRRCLRRLVQWTRRWHKYFSIRRAVHAKSSMYWIPSCEMIDRITESLTANINLATLGHIGSQTIPLTTLIILPITIEFDAIPFRQICGDLLYTARTQIQYTDWLATLS